MVSPGAQGHKKIVNMALDDIEDTDCQYPQNHDKCHQIIYCKLKKRFASL